MSAQASGLTAEQTAALAMLASSELGVKMRAETDMARAAARRQIIEKLTATVADRRAEAKRHADAAAKLEPKATAAYAAWRAAMHEHASEVAAASRAGDAAERAEARALRGLQDLGTAEIDTAVRELIFIESDARNACDWRVVPVGKPGFLGQQKKETVERTPGMLAHVDRLREMRAELAGLKLALLSPAEITARCAAALAEARGVDVPPLAGNERGRRALAVPPRGLVLT